MDRKDVIPLNTYFTIDLGIKDAKDSFNSAIIQSDKEVENLTPFGVNYLDKALGGIGGSDFVVIGARSGHGKTELCTHIALHNCKKKKRVLFFALEAHEGEIELRILYKLYAEELKQLHPNRITSYRDFLQKKHERDPVALVRANERAIKECAGLMLYYKNISFDIEDFKKRVLAMKDQIDMFVLDHIHYVDNEEKDEHRALTKMAKTLISLAKQIKKPLVCAAHVRKKDRADRTIVPSMDDIHGSSEIYKSAKVVVLLENDTSPVVTPEERTSFFYVAKSRLDSSPTKYVARVIYDSITNSYKESFQLGYHKPGNPQFEAITDQARYPHWAR